MAVRVLGGRYELVAFVGRGGMGEVWEGRDRVIERRVAVKLLPHDRRDASGAELFYREAKTAGGLNHAGVVTVFDMGLDPNDGTLYLVMEFLAGRDLDTVLRQDGPPEVATAVEWAAQTAAALGVAHAAGIVHRDLKPANLMLGLDGRVKILDFGIARYLASTHRSSKVIGTLAYMPPERFGEFPGDARSDLYSLGCVLHELLTGQPLFRAGDLVAMMAAHLHTTPLPPGQIRSGVPAALDDLVLALLAKNPDHRPASAAEVHHRLRELPTSTPGSVTDTSLPDAAPPAGAGPATPGGLTTIPRNHTPHQDPTATAPAPEHVPGPAAARTRPRRITRRTALGLGIGAAATAGITAALTLFDDGSRYARLRWRQPIGRLINSSPTVVDGVVYVGSDDNKMHALDARTGNPKWTYATGGNVDSLPTVVDGVVYFGSDDGSVYAVDAGTGNRAWAFPASINHNPVDESPAVAEGIVYIGSSNHVHALDATTGAVKWDFERPGTDWGFSSAAVVDGVVYFGGATNVYALDAATGKQKWASNPGTDRGFSSPVVTDGIVYTGNRKDVYALDAATGKQKWAFTIDSDFFSLPAVVDGVVYFGSNNSVYALDAATGAEKWIFTTGGSVQQPPVVVEGVLYVGSYDKNMYALDAATGKQRWAFTTGGGVSATPAVAERVVYVGSADGNMYALDATGKDPA
ncbi:serine/threonine protein kinase [Streptomyces sp. CB01635]|uniref:serine/threonine-protein kinase n=1 Tax=unclassified Streptomyces TaxID=2593676 RepID=UPI000C27AE60|nr:serine/threonine-protein kinase [Streptomyces sp. CB01635]PJN05344.1 serine/threonine protein kinase [Streptomyces sp. CB01635]